jgi:hypothetical protein
MFVTGLVNLYTRDIEAGLHFCADLLGFTDALLRDPDGNLVEIVAKAS